MYEEDQLSFMTMGMTGQDWEGKALTEIDMSQLELEYDYDTDEP